MNIKSPRRQLGLTMFELALTIAIASSILIAALPLQIEALEKKQVEVTATQMFTVGDVAQQFRADTGLWPGEANAAPCNIVTAMNELIAAGYLLQPLDRTAWGTPITTTCTPARFDVATVGPNVQRVQEAGGLLHTAQVAGTTLTSVFPAGAPPAFNDVLYRVPIAGRPELNQMQTALDMNNNDITNVAGLTATTVTATNLSVTGVATIPTVNGGTNLCADGVAGCRTSFAGNDGAFVTRPDGNLQLEVTNPGADLLITNPASGNGLGNATVNLLTAAQGVRWANNSELVNNEGGSIELGAGGTNPANPAAIGRPYIDFHFNGLTEDFNVRFQNSGNRTMTLGGAGGNLTTLVVEGDGVYTNNVEVVGNIAARDMISSVSNKAHSQSVQTMTIVPPETLVPVPGYCATLGMVPKIYTSAAAFAEGPTATPIYQVRTFAQVEGVNWRIKMQLLTESGLSLTPDPAFNSVLVAIKCEVA